MPETEAQRRAKLKYRKNKTKQVVVTFYPGDMELYEYLERHRPKAAFIKKILRENMKNNEQPLEYYSTSAII